jgi:hypothetical protein
MNAECARRGHDPELADQHLPVPACRRCGRILLTEPVSGHAGSAVEFDANDNEHLATLNRLLNQNGQR